MNAWIDYVKEIMGKVVKNQWRRLLAMLLLLLGSSEVEAKACNGGEVGYCLDSIILII